MDRLIAPGRALFALAIIGLAVEHFIFGDFITGRAPALADAAAGRLAWAYLSGAALAIVGAAILTGRKGRPAALFGALLVALWTVPQHVPVLLSEPLLSGAWTRAGKALVLSAGLLAMAATFPAGQNRPSGTIFRLTGGRDEAFVLAARVCLGLFFVITGIQHFMFTTFVASLIPAWFPGDAAAWTRFAGVALIAGGLGLFVTRTAALAGLLSGLMVFAWIWIVHVPRTFVTVSDSIAVFEAPAVSGLAFVLSGLTWTAAARGHTGHETAHEPRSEQRKAEL